MERDVTGADGSGATAAGRKLSGRLARQRAILRALWPRHGTKWLQRVFDVSERAAQGWMLGERDMGAERMARLLIECGPEAERRVLRLISETRAEAEGGCAQ